MISPKMLSYDVVLAGQYFLREIVERLTLEERMDEISCRATMDLVAPGEQSSGLPQIEPGHSMEVIGVPFGETAVSKVFAAGPAWDVQKKDKQRRRLNVTILDKTIFLAKSEDEYLFAEGTTATQRIQQIAADWNIPIYNLADTGQPLAKALHRAKSLWLIIQQALSETAEKSGKLFRLRYMPGTITNNPRYKFTPGGLELVEIGSNPTVWAFDYQENLEEVNHHKTLDGAVTKVKVLGSAAKKERSPVLGIVTGKIELGTLQRVYHAHKATTASAALKVAENMLAGVQETIHATGIDINTIRAGDKVQVEGFPELYTVNVKHDFGSPGHMTMQLAPLEYIRRRYYARRSL